MAKIADVLQTERSRQESTEWNKIHLFQLFDTDNFARIVEIDGDMLKCRAA